MISAYDLNRELTSEPFEKEIVINQNSYESPRFNYEYNNQSHLISGINPSGTS